MAGLVLLPIQSTVRGFPFFVPNFIYVVVAVTVTRYLFLLRLSWLRDRLLLQGAIAILILPLIFYMVQEFNAFVIYFDEQGPDVLTADMDRETGSIIEGYMHTEYRFFGVWAVIAAAVLPLRLLYNVWVRYRAGVR